MKYIALAAVLTVAAEGFSALGSREILLHDGEGNLINGANAYACYYDEYRAPANAINGSGLILKEDGTYSCGTDKTTLWMGAGDDKKFSNWFLIDLGREEYLDRIDLWNCNLKLGDTAYVDRGVKTLAVWTSTNESATNSLPFKSGGSLDNCMAPLGTSDANNFDWGENNENLDQTVWTLRANGEKVGELSQASGDENYSTPHEIRLAPGRARWVLLKIGGLFKSEYGSISELQFFCDDYCGVQALAPEAIKVNSAVLSAELSLKENVESGDVVLVYGKTQGGETVESWENSVTNFNALEGKTTFRIEGLERGTTYYYAFCVQEDSKFIWSGVTSFRTKKDYSVASFELVKVLPKRAVFNVLIDAAGGSRANVNLAFAENDMGERMADWSNVAEYEVEPGVLTELVLDEFTADGFYSVRLFTSEGESGSDAVRLMIGEVSAFMPSDFYESDPSEKKIVFLRPEACAAEEWTVFYDISGSAAAYYAEALPGSITFPAGSVAAGVAIKAVADDGAGDRELVVKLREGDYAISGESEWSVLIKDDSALTGGDVFWSGGAGDGKWWSPVNWSSGNVPTYLDSVFVTSECSEDNPVRLSQENATVKKLSLGSLMDSIGVLSVQDSAKLKATSGSYIGGETESGVGRMSVAGGSTVEVGGGALNIGFKSGSEGSVDMDGSLMTLDGNDIVVGASGDGALRVSGSGECKIGISGQRGTLRLGRYESGRGLITLNDNAKMHGGYYTKIGEHGYGEVTLNDDAYFYNESKGGITLGVETTGRGKIVIEGGKVVGTSQYGVIGNSGNGELYVHKGEFNTRGITIGKYANSSGYVEVGRNGVLSTGTTEYNLYVGEEGKGVLNILGGTVYYSKRGTCQIRKNASGAGLLTGWGTVKYSAQSGKLHNNGIIRADGGNENRVLAVQHTQPEVYNTIENDSTNGWYAINKGCLEIQGSAAYDVNDGVTVFNWGESNSDENIDLVNSVRFAVENITQKLTLGKARIYAPDHSDVPPLSSGKIVAGVWKFYFSGTYDSAQVQFRYDHTLAPKGIVIYQLSDDNSTWRKLDTSLLDGFRAQVSVSDASLMFAAVAQNPGLIITVR